MAHALHNVVHMTVKQAFTVVLAAAALFACSSEPTESEGGSSSAQRWSRAYTTSGDRQHDEPSWPTEPPKRASGLLPWPETEAADMEPPAATQRQEMTVCIYPEDCPDGYRCNGSNHCVLDN